MRRAFSLVELLAVVAILAVLAALLFPVFARSKARTKLTSCQSRLHSLAVALNLYRADHDGRGVLPQYGSKDPEYLTLTDLRGYLGGSSVLYCTDSPESPEHDLRFTRLHLFNLDPREGQTPRMVVPSPSFGTVVAYCENHARGENDARYSSSVLRQGLYSFVREDGSAGLARSEAILIGFYDARGWHDETSTAPRAPFLRFPGEPWPPVPEE